jgi:hypothetical protein
MVLRKAEDLEGVKFGYHANQRIAANDRIGVEVVCSEQPIEVTDRRLWLDASYVTPHVFLNGLLEKFVHRHSPFEMGTRHQAEVIKLFNCPGY